ncbi:MAG TPA: hypothetical protein PKH77_03830 [Anaerolineae bacterium]|nr:hypothetical protein [Anaerolineae bacterium]
MGKIPILSRILRFMGLVLLVDLALFAIVAATCLMGGTHCDALMWSDRMFWAGIIAYIGGAPAIIASLNTASGIEATMFGSAWAQEAAVNVISHEHKALGKRWIYFWHMVAIGSGAIAVSILISALA